MVEHINESSCYPDDPTPTIVSTIYTVVALSATLCVSIAGGIIGFKKAKAKKLAKIAQIQTLKATQQKNESNLLDIDVDILYSTKTNCKSASADMDACNCNETDTPGHIVTTHEHTNVTGMGTKQTQDKKNNTNNANDNKNDMSQQLKSMKMEVLSDNGDTNELSFEDALESESFAICDKKFAWYFIKYSTREAWNKKRCYLPFITHIIDQATDIAVIIRFYQIDKFERENKYDCPQINGGYLFWLSIAAFSMYRIISCIWVYNITNGKIIDTLSQIFDLKLYHALYINFVLNKQVPSNPQRYLQILEASLESFPQCVIQLYYLIKVGINKYNDNIDSINNTNNNNYSNNFSNEIIIVSLVFSILNISSKMVSEDKVYFPKQWHSLNFICTCNDNYQQCCMNSKYLLRVVLRLFDLVHRLLLILLTWVILGGVVVFIYLCFEFIALLIIAARLKTLSVIVWIAQTPFQFPFFWTNERFANILHRVLDKYVTVAICGICCCCTCYFGDNMNLGRWIAVMYRFVVSLVFSTILTIISYTPNYHDSNIQFKTWCLILLVLTLTISWLLSVLNGIVFENESNLTMDRSAANLLSIGGLNEVEDLKLFGMNTDNISDTAVFLAAKNGDIDGLKTLLDNGVNFSGTNQDGDTPLTIATRYNQTQVIEFMLTKQQQQQYDSVCDINQPNTQNGQTALMISVNNLNNHEHENINDASKDIDVVKMMVEKFNADVNVIDNDGNSALHYAAIKGNVDAIELLLNHDIDTKIRNKDGNTAVMEACAHGHAKCTKILKNKTKDFDINSTNKHGSTMLTLAAANNSLNLATYLLKRFAHTIDINSMNNDGFTALAHFVKHNNMEGAKILLSDPRIKLTTNAMQIAAEQGNFEILKLFLLHHDGQKLVNPKTVAGNDTKAVDTVLGCSIRSGNLEAVEFLIKSMGCDVNETVDADGNKPIMIAAQSNHAQLIEYLIDASSDCKAVNNDGNSALHYAARSGCYDGIRLLLQCGVDAEIVNNSGNTAVMEAIIYGKIKCFEILKKNMQDFDINVANKNGRTVLILAARNNKLESVEYLLRTFSDTIDINATDCRGGAAMTYFIYHKNIKGVKLLLSYSTIELEIVNAIGNTNAVFIAASKGSVEILKLFANHKDGKKMFYEKSILNNQQKWQTVLAGGAASGSLDVVKFLIESIKCSDVDEIVDGYGNRAVMFASRSNNVQLIEYLINKSKKSDEQVIRQMNDIGATPLFYAVAGDAVEAMKFLLAKYKSDIDINMKDKNGHTILMWAVINGSIHAIEYLLSNYQNTIDIGCQTNNGDTALSLATKMHHEKCIELLKLHGAC